MPTATSDLIARFARVYLQQRPSEATLSTYVSRVDSGAITLTQQLREFHLSSDRLSGGADELTRLFFIMFDRAPDYSSYAYAMNLLEAGMSMSELAGLAMQVRGGQLNLNQTNRAFVDKLASQMYEQPQFVSGITALKNTLVLQLEIGLITREQLLAAAVGYQDSQVKFVEKIDTALIAMAAAGREASLAEMDLYAGVSPMLVMRDILSSAGESPFGARPYFSVGKNSDNDPQLTISGSITGTFSLNLQTKLSTVAAVSNFPLVFSPDAGVSESVIRFRSSLISDYATLDCSGLLTTALTSVTITAPNSHFEYIGANKPNIVFAGSANDSLLGGTDADTLYAAAGADTLTGAAGADTFIFAPAATYRASAENFTEITDFGFGADKISFNRLFGKTTAAAAVTPIQADALPTAAQVTAMNGLLPNGVVLIRNSGTWINDDGDLIAATATNIATTFTTVSLTDALTTTTSKSYAVITYDVVNGADVWLVSNFQNLATIAASEIRLIGHIDSAAATDLLAALQVSGSILV